MHKQVRMVILVLGFCFFSLLRPGETKAEDFEVLKESNSVILKTDGQKFVVEANWGYDWLGIDKIGKGTICSLLLGPGCSWCTLAPKYFEEVKVVLDKEDEKVVYIRAKGYSQIKKKIIEPYYAEVNLRIKKGLPCLFIYQRVTNFTDSPQRLGFYFYARGFSTYAAADLKVTEMPPKGERRLASGANWLWGKRKTAEKGLGIISFTPTYFPGTKGSIYWGHKIEMIEEENSFEYKWAVMAADTPEEVKTLYEKVKDMKLEPFLRPGEQTVMLSNSKNERKKEND